MEAAYNEDDGFDWEAAIAAMEDFSLVDHRKSSNQRIFESYVADGADVKTYRDQGEVQSVVKVKQKTLDTFLKKTDKKQQMNTIKEMDHNLGQSRDETSEIRIDLDAAKSWIYPVNVPLREYQFSITRTALFTNTLVSLPTGLGKTLIAAVVMYNYFRWFPSGKIVFTAPSRPLVMQQIEACHNIAGISQEWTIDMTGQMNPPIRSKYWQEKRIFFVTPQVLEKDLHSGKCLESTVLKRFSKFLGNSKHFWVCSDLGILKLTACHDTLDRLPRTLVEARRVVAISSLTSSCPAKSLVCLVVDEAHRASGNYAYCVVVRKLMEMHVKLRILALTATPGSKQATIQAVVDNLQISSLEYRSEYDADVSQYTHSRKLELVQVALNEESVKIKDVFLEVLQPVVDRLCSLGVFYSRDAQRLVPFEFITARDRFRQAPPPTLDQSQFGETEAYFGAAITLYHIFKLLFSHGVRPALEMLQQKLQSGPFSRLMGRNEKLHQVKILMKQSVGNGAPSPKLDKLQELVVDHFTQHNPAETRAIIFTNFRESVKDILEVLKKLGQHVKAAEFIGQSSAKTLKGQTQKEQQAVIQKFRDGSYNIIVATCIGEEGLDIMEVDLVICFDANISPLRMIQRMGRTGRKRNGRVVVLASEGAEVQGYLKKQARSKTIGKQMHGGGLNSFNFHTSPRMVPHSIKSEPELVKLAIAKFNHRGKKVKQSSSDSLDPVTAEFTKEELLILKKYFNSPDKGVWKPSLIAFPHYQLLPTSIHRVRHSFRTTSMLVATLNDLEETRLKPSGQKKVAIFTRSSPITEHHHMESLLNGSEGKTTCPLEGQDELLKLPVPSTSDLVEQNFEAIMLGDQFAGVDPYLENEGDQLEILDELSKMAISPVPGGCHEVDLLATEATGRPKLHSKNWGQEGNPWSPCLEKANISPSHGEEIKQDCKQNQHECIFSKGFVGVNLAGFVEVATPPQLFLGDDCSAIADEICRKRMEEKSTTDSNIYCSSPSLMRSPQDSKFDAFCTEDNGHHTVLDRQDHPHVQSTDSRNITTPKEKGDAEYHFGRHTCNDNIPQVIPQLFPEAYFESEIGEKLFEEMFSLKLTLPQTLIPKTGCVLEGGDETNLCKEMTPEKQFGNRTPLINSDKRLNSLFTPEHGLNGCMETDGQRFDEFVASTPEDKIRHITESCQQDVTGSVCECNPDISGTVNSGFVQVSPLNKSGSEEWHLTCNAANSVHQPRRFKRLRKVEENARRPVAENSNMARVIEKKGSRNAREEKNQRRIQAQLFVDVEAEVSSDENVSDDEAFSSGDDSAGSFIDDCSQPTTAGDSIDMMAIYRKSLLTQSPYHRDGESLPWVGPHNSHTSSISGSDIRSTETPGIPTTVSKTCSKTVTISASDGESYARINAGKDFRELEDDKQTSLSVSERKRKLSFQNILATSYIVPGDRSEVQVTGNVGPSNASGKENQPWLSSDVASFDDDPFVGVDLDALEAEAAEKSRSHLSRCIPNSFKELNRSNILGTSHDTNAQPSIVPGYLPSFDLGFQ